MKEKLAELIELYTKGEVDLQILVSVREEILNMKKKDKKKLRTYSIAIGLLPETSGKILREIFLILTRLRKKKIISKIIAHRKIMGYVEARSKTLQKN